MKGICSTLFLGVDKNVYVSLFMQIIASVEINGQVSLAL